MNGCNNSNNNNNTRQTVCQRSPTVHRKLILSTGTGTNLSQPGTHRRRHRRRRGRRLDVAVTQHVETVKMHKPVEEIGATSI